VIGIRFATIKHSSWVCLLDAAYEARERRNVSDFGGRHLRSFLVRLLIAVAAVIIGFALASPAQSLQSDGVHSSVAARQQASTTQSSDAQTPDADPQTQDAHSFTGRVVREYGKLILKDTVTHVSYKFDDQSKMKQYVGKQVRVTGKLGLNSNTIHIENIEVLS
jgi:hypothetical protein